MPLYGLWSSDWTTINLWFVKSICSESQKLISCFKNVLFLFSSTPDNVFESLVYKWQNFFEKSLEKELRHFLPGQPFTQFGTTGFTQVGHGATPPTNHQKKKIIYRGQNSHQNSITWCNPSWNSIAMLGCIATTSIEKKWQVEISIQSI